MTVGRYLRRIGYDGVDELKREMLASASRTAGQVKGKFDGLKTDIREVKFLAALIQQQVDDLSHLYEITVSREWQKAIDVLLNVEEVYVVGYQNARGVAQYFASQLSYARANVQFVDGLNGTYVELLDGNCKDRYLFLLDVRRIASKARPLAEQARASGVKVILLSDDACIWAMKCSTYRSSCPARAVLYGTAPRPWLRCLIS